MSTTAPRLYYAAWWRRFAAFWIDIVVLSPSAIVLAQTARTSPRLYAALLIPMWTLQIAYFIFCHGRWGRTLGKLTTGTRVTALDGNRITWRQAFLRSGVEIVFGVLTLFALMPVYLSIPAEGYADLTSQARIELIRSMSPTWDPIMHVAYQVWIWSEFVVILLNRRRRALHDFIAGTIVVQKKPTRRQARDEDPYNIDCGKEMKRLQNL